MPSLLCFFEKAVDTFSGTNPWNDIQNIEVSFPGMYATCQIVSAGEFTNVVQAYEYLPDVASTIPGETINSFTCHFIGLAIDHISLSFSLIGVFQENGTITSQQFSLDTFLTNSGDNYDISDTMAAILETFFTSANNFTPTSGIFFALYDTSSENALCGLDKMAVEFFYGAIPTSTPHYINAQYYGAHD